MDKCPQNSCLPVLPFFPLGFLSFAFEKGGDKITDTAILDLLILTNNSNSIISALCIPREHYFKRVFKQSLSSPPKWSLTVKIWGLSPIGCPILEKRYPHIQENCDQAVDIFVPYMQDPLSHKASKLSPQYFSTSLEHLPGPHHELCLLACLVLGMVP